MTSSGGSTGLRFGTTEKPADGERCVWSASCSLVLCDNMEYWHLLNSLRAVYVLVYRLALTINQIIIEITMWPSAIAKLQEVF